jgi:predicted RNA-binding Zn ribbon-like protein
MRPFIRTIETLELDGEALCLNFINSVRNRFENPLYEFIVTPEDWLLWNHRAQLFDKAVEQKLKKYILENQKKAICELKRIIKIRELLYRIFRVIAQKERPLEEDIRIFNKELSFTFSHLSIEINERLESNLIWSYEQSDLMWALFPVVKSAYELLISDSLGRIKECSNCGWLYLDKSKNNSRIWCNMKTCGNSVKIKKYYEKKKVLASKTQGCT